MRAPFPVDLDRLAPQAVPGIRILPVLHGRIECTAVVRAVLQTLDPAAVAVELPKSVQTAVERAIARQPEISLLMSEPPDRPALIWVVAPGDPFVEALRWARSNEREATFVDPDLPYDDEFDDPIPDPYALLEIGPTAYLEQLREALAEIPATESDLARETGMAHFCLEARRRLDETPSEGPADNSADSSGDLLVLVGAAHAERLATRLQQPAARPFGRRRSEPATLVNVHPESLTGLLSDAPLSHAVWETVRSAGQPDESPVEETFGRKQSVVRFGFRLIAGLGGESVDERADRLVHHAARAGSIELFENGFVPDRRALERTVWRTARGTFEALTEDCIAPWQERLFFTYSRRLARMSGDLASSLYGWVVAGRGVGDDNLAWELFEAARTFPWQKESSDLATVRVDGTELDLGSRKIRFRRRFRRTKRRLMRAPVRARPQPTDVAEWLKGFDGESLCSYPPEDLVIEDFGRFLQKKAVSVLSSERTRIEPFSTSLLDGIDLRETLSHFYEGQIYVREVGRAPGKAGSVVMIFDTDDEDVDFPYKMTWQGEHDQESDMAFYATVPGNHVVGPGILRSTYGGLMLTMPRGRMADVWDDPDYLTWARTKPEVLLMAAIDYSEESLVVHVAESPPREQMRRYAAFQNKKIVHLPLGALSPVTLKKIRVLHILSGNDKREIAKDYIW